MIGQPLACEKRPGYRRQVLRPFQGQPAQPERAHQRTDDQRVLPHAVNLAEQQEARLLQRPASRRQRRRLNHQAQIRDREIGGRPIQFLHRPWIRW